MRSVACVLCTLSTLLACSLLARPRGAGRARRMNSGERAIVRAINRARASHGAARAAPPPPARPRRRRAHALDAAPRDYFAHGAFAQRVRRYVRFRRVGETIAMTTRCSARRVVRMWMSSAPHRAVLLARGFRSVGTRPPRRPARSLPRLPGDRRLRVAPLARVSARRTNR